MRLPEGRGVLGLMPGCMAQPPALGLKIVLVAGMAAYQALIGHRPAPRMIYLNMLAAFLILAISVLIVRNPDLALPLAPE